jgi:hypothetical protein
MDWFVRHRYLVLLVSLVLLLLIYPLLHDVFQAGLLYGLLLTVVTFAAVLAIFSQRRVRLLALLLATPLIAASWTGYVFPNVYPSVAATLYHGIAALFLGISVAQVLLSIYRDEAITADSICGAFCGYLVLGVAFGHLYCIVETLRPGSLHGDVEVLHQLRDPQLRHFTLTYFSLVTLTTVGYGDIIAQTAAARGLAAVEAVVGQFYIAVLIAELIGRRVSSVSSGSSDQKE